MTHVHTWVKVNAPVDEGIAGLVSALSDIDGLETIESCQGEPGTSDAFVLFRYGGWRECGAFVFERLLPSLPADLLASVSVTIEAYAADHAIGRVAVDPAAVEPLAECVRQLAATDHSSGCSDGR